jgi:hypothetical protein
MLFPNERRPVELVCLCNISVDQTWLNMAVIDLISVPDTLELIQRYRRETRELDQPHLYTVKGVSRLDREMLDVVMLSMHQEPTSCTELFNPHEICTPYARTCTIIMASACFDRTRNLINLSSLRVAQSSLRQYVISLSKRSFK